MRYGFFTLVAALAIAGAAHAEIDKAKLGEARSLVAEAAAVEHLRATRRITSSYADGLRDDLRKDLQKLVKAPGVGPAAAEGIAALDRHDEAALVRLRDRLVSQEKALGRAS